MKSATRQNEKSALRQTCETYGFRTVCTARLLPLLLLLTLPAAVQAQFNYTTNHGTAQYTGGQNG